MDEAGLQRALASYKRVSETVRRDMLEPEATRGGNDNTVWKTMESGIRVMSRRYIATALPIELFEVEIRDIWYMFTVAAQNTEVHHPAQDTLLRIISCAQGRGVLQRMTKQETAIGASELIEEEPTPLKAEGQVAETSQGRIWVDMPFLVQDVRDAWKKLMEPSASFTQRCNLTAAIARLAGSRVCGHSFSQCGLEIMKQALETPPIPLSPSSSPSGFDNSGERLALVEIWLRYAGEELLRQCLDGSTYIDFSWALDGQQSVGPLAREAGIDPATAFSRERFLLWKNRLEAMKAEPGDDMTVDVRCALMITAIWDDYFGILPYKRA
ncbi:hypothetical protein F5Y19DRAFT_57919 [Xylariaceae sp. FL1651]|nr:hypothetical protein F5Y19DRAFT_57919 [Xylariaceae sp. FL1651]